MYKRQTADRPPSKLSRIQERIKSRFSGGLVIDIQQPDSDLRYKIVKLKSQELEKFYYQAYLTMLKKKGLKNRYHPIR